MVFTVGIVTTDPAHHSFSKIAGDVTLSIDIRSASQGTLDRVAARVCKIAHEISEAHGVVVELGRLTSNSPATMDSRLRDALGQSMERLGVPSCEMASGAVHDAAVFARAGVRSAMLFIRNANGSHNPREEMALADFAMATRVLAEGLVMIDRL